MQASFFFLISSPPPLACTNPPGFVDSSSIGPVLYHSNSVPQLRDPGTLRRDPLNARHTAPSAAVIAAAALPPHSRPTRQVTVILQSPSSFSRLPSAATKAPFSVHITSTSTSTLAVLQVLHQTCAKKGDPHIFINHHLWGQKLHYTTARAGWHHNFHPQSFSQ